MNIELILYIGFATIKIIQPCMCFANKMAPGVSEDILDAEREFKKSKWQI